MKAVILAGGLGTRLSEDTHLVPKPLIEIGQRPILWHIMKIAAAHGIREFVICLGYKGGMIKEFFANYSVRVPDLRVDLGTGEIEQLTPAPEDWSVTLVDTGLNAQTGGRLKAVAPYLGDEPFLFTYGDGVADIDVGALRKFHEDHGKRATVTAVRQPSRYGVLELRGDSVHSFREKPLEDQSYINGGFFILDPSVVELIDGPDTAWEDVPLRTLADNGEMMAYHHDGFWHSMDTLRDKNALEKIWQSGEAPWKVW